MFCSKKMLMIILALTIGFLALTHVSEVKAILNVGVNAPSFTLVDAISGNQVSLSDYAGKIIVMDFFATWCGPCRRAIDEELVPLYNQYYASDSNVVFLSIDIWEPSITRAQLVEFANEHNMGWAILMGSNSNIANDYGIEGVPTLYIVDGDGVIRWCHMGATPGLGNEIRNQIEAIPEFSISTLLVTIFVMTLAIVFINRRVASLHD